MILCPIALLWGPYLSIQLDDWKQIAVGLISHFSTNVQWTALRSPIHTPAKKKPGCSVHRSLLLAILCPTLVLLGAERPLIHHHTTNRARVAACLPFPLSALAPIKSQLLSLGAAWLSYYLGTSEMNRNKVKVKDFKRGKPSSHEGCCLQRPIKDLLTRMDCLFICIPALLPLSPPPL